MPILILIVCLLIPVQLITLVSVFATIDTNLNTSIPRLDMYDNTTKIVSTSSSGYWDYERDPCISGYICTADNSTSSNDLALKVSTTSSLNNSWSRIMGLPLNLRASESIMIGTNMKLDNFSVGSHMSFEGYDEFDDSWKLLFQCPAAEDGPLAWTRFSCEYSVTNSTNLDKLRPILNAGWSKVTGEEANTWFGDIYMIKTKDKEILPEPSTKDPDLRIENYSGGHQFMTGIAFLGSNDLIVTEKNTGIVKRIQNGTVTNLLDFNVATLEDRGLLGLAVAAIPNSTESKYLFFYLTETINEDEIGSANSILGNRLYRYELQHNGSLVNPKLLLDLPAMPGPYHNGGQILIGKNNTLYLTVGDLFGDNFESMNIINGSSPDGRAGILWTDFDGKPMSNILGNTYPLNAYFAYGIRNSYGMDIDPISGKLWDSENGPNYGDELNLVEPGFNSGWNKIQGIWNAQNETMRGGVELSPKGLIDFNGKGEYKSPQLTWNGTIGPTAIKFVNSSIYGPKYENDLLMADVNGRIYHFQLDSNRTSLVLDDNLSDGVVNSTSEIEDKVFAKNLGIISDLELGPEGYIHVISNSGGFSDQAEGSGSIMRILPRQ